MLRDTCNSIFVESVPSFAVVKAEENATCVSVYASLIEKERERERESVWVRPEAIVDAKHLRACFRESEKTIKGSDKSS